MKKEEILVEVFVRYCKLCGDPLPHNCHANREFCPWKNGRSNDCKLKFVEILKQMKLVGYVSSNINKGPSNKSLPGITNVEPDKKTQGGAVQELPEISMLDARQKNIEIISKLIGDAAEIEVGEKMLYKTGYDKTVYDIEVPFRYQGLFQYNIGPYGILPFRKQTYLLTNLKTHITWIQE